MSNVAIMTDSNSGITQKCAKELGIKVIPMPFHIDGTEYFEDISLTQDGFYSKLIEGAEIFTSQPAPQCLMDAWEEALKTYDEVVYIPMSSGLSSSCQTATVLAEEYDGKVQVVNNQRISITMKNSVKDGLFLAQSGCNAAEIKEKLEDDKMNATIYITLDTLTYLKRGGRITPAAATLGTLLKIKPVLQIQGEKLDAFAKARTLGMARNTMINAIKNDIDNRLSENGKYQISIGVAHTQNSETAEELKEELKTLFPQAHDIYADPLSLSISCHIGPGALAIAASRIMA
ncbi:MAG TPA: DegV family protein [Lachnospiraceae bacterium]|nr:DegV family protein [Lachnospiraceae bacterium]HPF29496.1 DegV family protein [Lachnospiraceae bacterium]